jgi:hypothetical protein
VRGEGDEALRVVRAIDGVKKARREAHGDLVALGIELGKDADVGAATEAIVLALTTAGLGVREVTPTLASLEQVFSELTREPAGEPEGATPEPEESA